MRTRLRHRIPVPLRHHWKLLALAVALLVVTVGVLGAIRVRPVVLTDADADDKESIVDIAGTVDLFDTTASHSVAVTFAAKDYDNMVKDFLAGGDKDYVPADLVVDGTPLPRAGIRLKGNSTLMALRRGTNRGFGPTPVNGAPRGAAVAHQPRSLRGRAPLPGHETLAVRPPGRSGSTLNEALGLTLVGLAGEPTQRHAYSSFAVNGRPVTTRLLVEVGAGTRPRSGRHDHRGVWAPPVCAVRLHSDQGSKITVESGRAPCVRCRSTVITGASTVERRSPPSRTGQYTVTGRQRETRRDHHGEAGP